MTSPPREAASLDTLREAARVFVDSTSLRHAARDIGMSPTGLRGFLDGAEPYVKTARKLADWYIREAQRGDAGMTPHAASAALDLLTRTLPAARGAPAAAELVDVLHRHFAGHGVPAWLAELRGRHHTENPE